MEAMVVRIEAPGHGPFEKYGPCHYHDLQPDSREEETALPAAFFQRPAVSGLKDGLSQRCTSPRSLYLDGSCAYTHEPPAAFLPTPLVNPLLSLSSGSSTPTTLKSGTSLPPPQPLASLSSSSPAPFSFIQDLPTTQKSFSFPNTCIATPALTLKRRRPLTDVDGPYTGSLSCKKRRLRRRLITSKLSQPFSLPATHVISREAAASGDKRFLKLAAISAARRLNNAVSAPSHQQHHASPSSLLRRAAMINRFRLRVRNEAAERGHIKVADVAANAALLQQSHGLGLVVGARFPATSQMAPPPGVVAQVLRVPQANPPHLLAIAATPGRPSAPGPSIVTGLESGGSNARSLPPSRPEASANTYPGLGPATDDNGGDDDGYDVDDGETAFPNSEHDSRYDPSDEPEDVYTDFELIFGGGGDAESSDEDGEHYEDVMDDLDGIPWTVR